jgi:hypothetical protein
MIAEENPTLIGYDENKFVANLFYEDQSADQAIALLDAIENSSHRAAQAAGQGVRAQRDAQRARHADGRRDT